MDDILGFTNPAPLSLALLEQTLVTLLDNLRQQLPDSEFSFIEQDNTLGA